VMSCPSGSPFFIPTVPSWPGSKKVDWALPPVNRDSNKTREHSKHPINAGCYLDRRHNLLRAVGQDWPSPHRGASLSALISPRHHPESKHRFSFHLLPIGPTSVGLPEWEGFWMS
jgi:hypothetical protein